MGKADKETVQRCKSERSSFAKVQKWEAALKGGSIGEPDDWLGHTSSGDGHGHREFWSRHFGHRELAAGFRRLRAEWLIPERLTTVVVTRHLE